MQKRTMIVLPSIMLLLVILGIALSDVFAEKLIISDGFSSNAQFSVIDETTGEEIQLFSDGQSPDLILGSMDFSSDGFLIGTNAEFNEEEFGFFELSITINEGEPQLIITDTKEEELEVKKPKKLCVPSEVTPP